MAAGYPAGPPPMTITSYSLAIRFSSDAEQQPRWIFQAILDGHEELHGFAPVDDAVIVRQGHVHHGPDDDLAVDHHGAIHGLVHAEDGALRHVDDRCRLQRTER